MRDHLRIAAWIATAALAFGAGAVAAEEEPQERAARFKPARTYYLHVPASYELGRGDRLPLFVAVHAGMTSGRGEFRLWQPYADEEQFVLLTPNFSEGYQTLEAGSDLELLKLVEEVSAEYRIDRRKILLVGVGEGGEFAYRFAMRYPHFAHTVVLIHPGELPEPARAHRGEAPRFFLVLRSADEASRAQGELLAQQLRGTGYVVHATSAAAGGATIPSDAVLDVVRLVRAMKIAHGAEAGS
jgi:poly(3-hydroxybutyrate) depolymerase